MPVGRKSQFDWNIVILYLEDRGVKESTVKQHLIQIRRVLKGLYPDKAPTLSQIKRSLGSAVEWIKAEGNLPNYASRKNHMTSMYQFYEALDINTKKMMKPFEKIVELAMAERSGGLTGKVKEKFDKVNFKNIKDSIEETEDPEIRLMKVLYSGDMPILRGQEWRGLKVITAKKIAKKSLPENYLHLPSKTLHITEAKSLGGATSKEMDIPSNVIDEIKQYLDKVGGDTLFPALSASSMTKKMNKELGYSIQALRKRYVSERVKEGISPEERAKLARLMGHSLFTSVLDYTKPIEDKDE